MDPTLMTDEELLAQFRHLEGDLAGLRADSEELYDELCNRGVWV